MRVLISHTQTVDERRALVKRVYGGTRLQRKIIFNGNARSFSFHLLMSAIAYGELNGEPAVVPLLNEVRRLAGENPPDKLEQNINYWLKSGEYAVQGKKERQALRRSQPFKPFLTQLSRWNPIEIWSLLWWLSFKPENITDDHVKKSGAPLVVTLLLMPVLILFLAVAMRPELISGWNKYQNSVPLFIFAVIIVIIISMVVPVAQLILRLVPFVIVSAFNLALIIVVTVNVVHSVLLIFAFSGMYVMAFGLLHVVMSQSNITTKNESHWIVLAHLYLLSPVFGGFIVAILFASFIGINLGVIDILVLFLMIFLVIPTRSFNLGYSLFQQRYLKEHPKPTPMSRSIIPKLLFWYAIIAGVLFFLPVAS